MARGSRAYLQYIPEVTFGTTPGTPQMIEVPAASFTTPLTKTGFTTRDRRSDRHIVDYRFGRQQGAFTVEADYRKTDFDTWLEAVLMGTWTTNVLKAGTTNRHFTLEAGFTDISEYHSYKGCRFNSFKLSVGLDGPVKATFGGMYRELARSATPLDSTPTAVSTNPAFDSFTGSILEGGASIAIVTGVELNLDNGMSPQNVVFDDRVTDFVDGKSTLTGQISAYFESDTLFAKFRGETATSLSFTLTDSNAATHTFLVPRMFYTGGDGFSASGDGPIVVTLPFQAVRDSTEATNLKVTRSAA